MIIESIRCLHEANPANGLIRDKTLRGAPASIAAVGLALATIPVLVEHGVISREFAPEIALRRLRFFRDSPHGPEPDATGYKGFYYHFLDMKSGRRVWQCELSTIDSAFLFAGMLTCAAYFDQDTEEELEVRRLADALYRRADWQWALNGGTVISHGWRPETGFIPHRWTGYDEGLLLYLLGLGSPTFPLPPESYAAYCSTYQWKTIYGREVLYSGPLFTHQLSHLWIDFRNLQDAFMSVGESPPPMAPVGRSGAPATASSVSSTTTMLAERPTGQMTGRSHRGWWSRRCRSHLKS